MVTCFQWLFFKNARQFASPQNGTWMQCIAQERCSRLEKIDSLPLLFIQIIVAYVSLVNCTRIFGCFVRRYAPEERAFELRTEWFGAWCQFPYVAIQTLCGIYRRTKHFSGTSVELDLEYYLAYWRPYASPKTPRTWTISIVYTFYYKEVQMYH